MRTASRLPLKQSNAGPVVNRTPLWGVFIFGVARSRRRTAPWLQQIMHDRYRQSLLDRANPLPISQVRRAPDFHGHNSTSASNSHRFVKRDRKILPPKAACLRGTIQRPLPKLVSTGRPRAQSKDLASAHEQMNMIRHDYITPNGDVEVTLGTLGISDERRVDFIAREIWLPQVSAKGDKIERARVKETNETWRAASEILLHAELCSHGPAGRPIMTRIPALVNRPQAGGYNNSLLRIEISDYPLRIDSKGRSGSR
jgi:hypothetical protein